MTEEQAARLEETLARIATALESIGRQLEQRKSAPRASTSVTSIRSAPTVSSGRRPTPA